MKVLILSCNTGEGHNSAGRAICEALRARGIECEMIDSLQFGLRGESKVISRGHVFLYRRMPLLFGASYMILENHNPQNGASLVYRMNNGKRTGAADKLRAYIQSRGFDTVVCVHVFPAAALTYLRREYGAEWRQYFVATDYTCSPGAGDAEMDAYFTPHSSLHDEFAACGVPRERMIASGIPVSARFHQHLDSAEAKRKLGLPEEKRMVLMMSGSMGAGPIGRLVRRMSGKLPQDAELVVICGRNKKLERQLGSYGLENVRVLGYTKEVDLYMDAAELVLTKAGGLSSTEALMKRLPIVYLNAVPGCETRNRDFLCRLGCAITENGVERLADATVHLLADAPRLERMRACIEENFRMRASDDIAASLIRDQYLAISPDKPDA